MGKKPRMETDVVKIAQNYVAAMEQVFGGKGSFPESKIFDDLCKEIERLRAFEAFVLQGGDKMLSQFEAFCLSDKSKREK